MTPERLKELKELCEKTPMLPYKDFPIYVGIENNGAQAELINSYIKLGFESRTAIPELIAEVERLEKENMELRDELLDLRMTRFP